LIDADRAQFASINFPKCTDLRTTRQGSEDLAQMAMRGLFPGPLPPRQVADFSVGKLVGFLAAPHHAEITISSASHCATQLATLHVARTT
jgi:hypothetical protein